MAEKALVRKKEWASKAFKLQMKGAMHLPGGLRAKMKI